MAAGRFELKKKKKKKDVVWRHHDIGGKQPPWPVKICWKHLGKFCITGTLSAIAF